MLKHVVDARVNAQLYPRMSDMARDDDVTHSIAGVNCIVRSPTGTAPRRTAVYIHGNATTLRDLEYSPWLQDMADKMQWQIYAPAYDTTALDAPGAHQDTLQYECIRRVLQSMSDTSIVLVGRSLGCALALGAISPRVDLQQRIDAVHLISPFAKLDDIVPRWLATTRMHTTGRLDNVSNMDRLQASIPMHIYHGEYDEVVPIDNSIKLFSTRRCKALPATCTTFDVIRDMQHDPSTEPVRSRILACMTQHTHY